MAGVCPNLPRLYNAFNFFSFLYDHRSNNRLCIPCKRLARVCYVLKRMEWN
jgi:hypothetical protein